MIEIKEFFPNILVALRQQKGWSQSELAAKLEFSQATVSFWENGIKEPSATAIRKIALLFEVTSDYLLALENEDGSKIG